MLSPDPGRQGPFALHVSLLFLTALATNVRTPARCCDVWHILVVSGGWQARRFPPTAAGSSESPRSPARCPPSIHSKRGWIFIETTRSLVPARSPTASKMVSASFCAHSSWLAPCTWTFVTGAALPSTHCWRQASFLGRPATCWCERPDPGSKTLPAAQAAAAAAAAAAWIKTTTSQVPVLRTRLHPEVHEGCLQWH